MVRTGLALMALLGSACAPIMRGETFVDVPVAPLIETDRIDGSVAYDITPSVHGDVLQLQIARAEQCRTFTRSRSRRTIAVTRTADSSFMNTTWAMSLLMLAVGVYAYADAEGLADRALLDDPTSASTADDYRLGGALSLGTGGLAGVVGIGNLVRAADSTDDGGLVSGTATTHEGECHREFVAARSVELRLGTDVVLAARTDDTGNVTFAMNDVPAKAVPGAGVVVAVTVDDTRSVVELPGADVAALQATLAGDATSRYARDVVAQQDAACRAAVAGAGAVRLADVRAEPEAALARWSSAQQACGERWTPDHERQAVAVRSGVIAARCDIALARIDERQREDRNRASIALFAEDLARANASCTDARQLGAARASYATALATLDAEEVADDAARAMQDTRVEFETALEDANPEDAYRLLGVAGLKTYFTQDTIALAWAQLRIAVDAVLASDPSAAVAARQMCFSRGVFEAVVGKSALRQAVQRFVNQVGTRAPAYAARVVRALKAGRCK